MADQKAPAELPQGLSETAPARRRGRPKGSKNKRPAGIPVAAQALVAAHRESRASSMEAADPADQRDAARITAWIGPDLDRAVRDRADQMAISVSQSFRELIELGVHAQAHLAMLRNIERGINAVASNVERVAALADADAMRQTLTSGLDPNQAINQRLDRLEEHMQALPATLAESISQSFAPVLLALAGAKDVLSGSGPSVPVQPAKGSAALSIPQRPQSHSINPSSPPSVGGVGAGINRPSGRLPSERIATEIGGAKS